MKAICILVAAIAFHALTGCGTTNAPPAPVGSRSPQKTTLVHAGSGIEFPPEIGDFKIVTTNQYDTAGEDVSAGYNLLPPHGTIAATVYVYPAPRLVSVGSPPAVVDEARAVLLGKEFERRKSEVFNHHPGAKLLKQGDATVPQLAGIGGKMASFEFDALFGGQLQPVHSELYVFCFVGGKWAIQYRFTHPAPLDSDKTIDNFMKAWPVALKGT